MAILIANLGTSDLTVQVEDFFFPILQRDFMNVDLSELSQEEREAWEKGQRDFFVTGLASELGISEKNFTFREISRKLLDSYRDNPELWHHRIHPGRIWGAIQKALEFQVKQVHLFVTNQPESATKGYPTDTIHVFEILKLWLTRQGLNLELHKQEIPQHISPVQEDQLFEYYYDFFTRLISQINNDPVILVSIKGGTV